MGTPEGELPGTRPAPQHARPYAFGSFQAFPNSPVIPEVQGSPFLAYAKTLPSTDQRRPRSDTNRSAGGISNFSADFGMLTRFLPSSMRQLGERAAVAAGVRTVAVQQQGSLVARCAAHSEAVIVQDMSQALQLGDILFEGAWSM